MRPNVETPIVLYVDVASPGGTAVYTVNLGSGLRREGYQVAVICSGAEDTAPMRRELQQIGIIVHTLNDQDRSLGGRVRRILDFFVLLRRRYRGGVLCLLLGNYVSGGPVMLAGAVAGMGTVVRAD